MWIVFILLFALIPCVPLPVDEPIAPPGGATVFTLHYSKQPNYVPTVIPWKTDYG